MRLSSPLPHVTVLLATYNGALWLKEQIRTIVTQEGVQVRVVASDDQSQDDTLGILQSFAKEGVIELLPPVAQRFGNANRNFMRLIADASLEDTEWVAFADQDDIWLPDKLHHAVTQLVNKGFDAYSSDVVAFWPDGRERRLVKSGTQRTHDHLFESAGPGCTFVLPKARFLELQAWVRDNREAVDRLKVHDWAIYAWARAQGLRWLIDPKPTLRYRQHGGNEVGANVGWRAARARLSQALSGQYVADALLIASVVGIETPLVHRMRRMNLLDRLVLATMAAQCRRRRAEGWLLAMIFLLMKRPAASRH